MGKRLGRKLALTGIDHNTSIEELRRMSRDVLEDGMHGICFSLYEDGQEPGDVITEEQIRNWMKKTYPMVEEEHQIEEFCVLHWAWEKENEE